MHAGENSEVGMLGIVMKSEFGKLDSLAKCTVVNRIANCGVSFVFRYYFCRKAV